MQLNLSAVALCLMEIMFSVLNLTDKYATIAFPFATCLLKCSSQNIKTVICNTQNCSYSADNNTRDSWRKICRHPTEDFILSLSKLFHGRDVLLLYSINFSTARQALVPISEFVAFECSCVFSELWMNISARYSGTCSSQTVLASLTYIEQETLFWEGIVLFKNRNQKIFSPLLFLAKGQIATIVLYFKKTAWKQRS